jgi:hypothetical protein
MKLKATPLAAGIFALLIQARGKLSVSELTNIISSTSKPISYLNDTRPIADLAPVAQQGPGLAQAYNAVHTSGVLSIAKLTLNDTDHFEQSHSFNVRNTGSKEVTYVLGHQGAGTAYTLLAGSIDIARRTQVEIVKSFATITFGQSNITVAPGAEAKITISVTPPSGLDAKRLPLYSGFITLDGSNGDKLSLPYLGVAGRYVISLNLRIKKAVLMRPPACALLLS